MKGLIFDVKHIPALGENGGGLVLSSAEKASLLSYQFDLKQCPEQFVTPLYCFSQSRCNFFIFRTPILLCLLLELNIYGGVDPLRVFPLFLKLVANIIASQLSIIFNAPRSFPECWQSANVTDIPKGASIMSKVYEK